MTDWGGGRGRRPRSRGFLHAALGVALLAALAPSGAQAAITPTIDGPVSEAAPGAELTVTLSRGGAFLQPNATVRVRAAGGTATPGADHVPTDTTVTIPGTLFGTSARVAIGVRDDALDEADETVVVTVTEASGDSVAGDGVVTGTILDDDDDAPPSISIDDASGVEGTGAAGTVVLPLRLSAASGRAVSAAYAISPRSASAGDLDTRGGSVVVPAGATRGSVTVTTTADAVDEADETFTVTLRDPVHATLGRSAATGTIVDDDVPAPVAPPAPATAPIVPVPAASTPVLGVSGGPVAAGPSSTTAASRGRHALRVRSVTLRRPRTLRMQVTCPSEKDRCRVRTTVFTVPNRKAKRRDLRREIRLARVTRTIPGGATRTVTARISTRGLRLLRSAKRLRIRAYAVATDSSDDLVTGRRTVTIRR